MKRNALIDPLPPPSALRYLRMSAMWFGWLRLCRMKMSSDPDSKRVAEPHPLFTDNA